MTNYYRINMLSLQTDLLLGPEHDGERHVVVPDCELCDAVIAQLLEGIDP